MPPAFTKRPRLTHRLEFAFHAFWELSTDRQVNMVLGPIPSRSIREFARDCGIAGERFDAFVASIRVLDGEYLRRLNPKPDK